MSAEPGALIFHDSRSDDLSPVSGKAHPGSALPLSSVDESVTAHWPRWHPRPPVENLQSIERNAQRLNEEVESVATLAYQLSVTRRAVSGLYLQRPTGSRRHCRIRPFHYPPRLPRVDLGEHAVVEGSENSTVVGALCALFGKGLAEGGNRAGSPSPGSSGGLGGGTTGGAGGGSTGGGSTGGGVTGGGVPGGGITGGGVTGGGVTGGAPVDGGPGVATGGSDSSPPPPPQAVRRRAAAQADSQQPAVRKRIAPFVRRTSDRSILSSAKASTSCATCCARRSTCVRSGNAEGAGWSFRACRGGRRISPTRLAIPFLTNWRPRYHGLAPVVWWPHAPVPRLVSPLPAT